MKLTLNNYVGDELAHKVRILSQALSQTKQAISILEIENNRLKDILNNLVSINKEDCTHNNEALSVNQSY